MPQGQQKPNGYCCSHWQSGNCRRLHEGSPIHRWVSSCLPQLFPCFCSFPMPTLLLPPPPTFEAVQEQHPMDTPLISKVQHRFGYFANPTRDLRSNLPWCSILLTNLQTGFFPPRNYVNKSQMFDLQILTLFLGCRDKGGFIRTYRFGKLQCYNYIMTRSQISGNRATGGCYTRVQKYLARMWRVFDWLGSQSRPWCGF